MQHLRLAALPSLLALLSSLVCLPACGGATPASALVSPPEYMPKGQTKCSVKSSQAEPLIVEWPPAERGRLEADLHAGVVAVKYDGCEIKLLPYCRVKESSYRYVPLTRKADSVHISNEDQLFADLPLGAVSLEGKLKETGQLNVDMILVGRWESGRGEVKRREMDGDGCDHATHVISAVTVGAFTFSAGGDADVNGSLKVFNAGAGGESTSKKETLSSDGDTSACSKATNKDTDPPDDCGALLRIEVVPIREGGEISTLAPSVGAGLGNETTSTEPPPVQTSEPEPLPAPVEPPRPFPTNPTTHPYYDPPSTSGSGSYSLAGSAGSPNTGSGTTKGPLGTIVAWSAAGAFGVGALLGALGYSQAQSTVGSDSSSGDGHCNKQYGFCDSTGQSEESKAKLEALFGDILMGAGLALGVTYLFLPKTSSSPSTTVSLSPAPNGGSLGLRGSF